MVEVLEGISFLRSDVRGRDLFLGGGLGIYVLSRTNSMPVYPHVR